MVGVYVLGRHYIDRDPLDLIPANHPGKISFLNPSFRSLSMKGQAITPLYPNQVKAALYDEKLYDKLALVDAVREEGINFVPTPGDPLWVLKEE